MWITWCLVGILFAVVGDVAGQGPFPFQRPPRGPAPFRFPFPGRLPFAGSRFGPGRFGRRPPLAGPFGGPVRRPIPSPLRPRGSLAGRFGARPFPSNFEATRARRQRNNGLRPRASTPQQGPDQAFRRVSFGDPAPQFGQGPITRAEMTPSRAGMAPTRTRMDPIQITDNNANFPVIPALPDSQSPRERIPEIPPTRTDSTSRFIPPPPGGRPLEGGFNSVHQFEPGALGSPQGRPDGGFVNSGFLPGSDFTSRLSDPPVQGSTSQRDSVFRTANSQQETRFSSRSTPEFRPPQSPPNPSSRTGIFDSTFRTDSTATGSVGRRTAGGQAGMFDLQFRPMDRTTETGASFAPPAAPGSSRMDAGPSFTSGPQNVGPSGVQFQPIPQESQQLSNSQRDTSKFASTGSRFSSTANTGSFSSTNLSDASEVKFTAISIDTASSTSPEAQSSSISSSSSSPSSFSEVATEFQVFSPTGDVARANTNLMLDFVPQQNSNTDLGSQSSIPQSFTSSSSSSSEFGVPSGQSGQFQPISTSDSSSSSQVSNGFSFSMPNFIERPEQNDTQMRANTTQKSESAGETIVDGPSFLDDTMFQSSSEQSYDKQKNTNTTSNSELADDAIVETFPIRGTQPNGGFSFSTSVKNQRGGDQVPTAVLSENTAGGLDTVSFMDSTNSKIPNKDQMPGSGPNGL